MDHEVQDLAFNGFLLMEIQERATSKEGRARRGIRRQGCYLVAPYTKDLPGKKLASRGQNGISDVERCSVKREETTTSDGNSSGYNELKSLHPFWHGQETLHLLVRNDWLD